MIDILGGIWEVFGRKGVVIECKLCGLVGVVQSAC